MFKFTFTRPNKVDIKFFEEQISKLRVDMHEITSGDISEGEALEYCICAFKAFEYCGNGKLAMWPLDDPNKMPGDARVDFVYIPTYIISGILMYSWMNYSSVRNFPDLGRLLPKALDGCMGRNFRGHGYEAEEGFMETMKIFDECKVWKFVKEYPDINPEFTNRYTQAYARWMKMLGKS